MTDVDILFDDEGVLIVDKPAGLDMDELRDAMCASFDVEHGPSFLGRIDRPTSGLVIATLTRDALKRVLPSWESGAIEKHYLVVVHGTIKAKGEIDIALADRRHRRPGRRETALTTFERLATSGGVSLVDARLHTGRTHQIRRHMKAIGHPVVGDPRYGHEARDAALTTSPLGLCLHSWRIKHDGSAPTVPKLVEAPMPERMRSFFPDFP